MTEFVSTIPNAKQYEEWNNATGRRWLERHEAVDRQIAPFGRQAMDRAHIKPGEHILDVGCGCGETTLELADRVGASGSVTGVDISRPLIEAARKRTRELDRANVQFEEGDAQTFPFPAKGFDLVFSRFGIMFFDDSEAAFQNLGKALRPGGRLSFVCWPAPQENQFMTDRQVSSIRVCHDSYFVTTADGKTVPFWEPNLRFKTDSSATGPLSGKPVILPAGMMGDRASGLLCVANEVSPFIKHQC